VSQRSRTQKRSFLQSMESADHNSSHGSRFVSYKSQLSLQLEHYLPASLSATFVNSSTPSTPPCTLTNPSCSSQASSVDETSHATISSAASSLGVLGIHSTWPTPRQSPRRPTKFSSLAAPESMKSIPHDYDGVKLPTIYSASTLEPASWNFLVPCLSSQMEYEEPMSMSICPPQTLATMSPSCSFPITAMETVPTQSSLHQVPIAGAEPLPASCNMGTTENVVDYSGTYDFDFAILFESDWTTNETANKANLDFQTSLNPLTSELLQTLQSRLIHSDPIPVPNKTCDDHFMGMDDWSSSSPPSTFMFPNAPRHPRHAVGVPVPVPVQPRNHVVDMAGVEALSVRAADVHDQAFSMENSAPITVSMSTSSSSDAMPMPLALLLAPVALASFQRTTIKFQGPLLDLFKAAYAAVDADIALGISKKSQPTAKPVLDKMKELCKAWSLSVPGMNILTVQMVKSKVQKYRNFLNKSAMRGDTFHY